MDQIDRDYCEITNLERQLNQLFTIAPVIKEYGVNHTTYRLLTSTSIVATTGVAMESFTAEIALEGIVDKIKETAAKWSAKIISFIKNSIKKVTDSIHSIFEKIKDRMKTLKDASHSKLSEVTKVIKAHPYKTIAITLASIAAVVGLLFLVSRKFPKPSSSKSEIDMFTKSFTRAVEKINSPFCDLKVSENNLKVSVTSKIVDRVSGTPQDLGYTDPTISSLMNSTNSMMNGMNSSWKSFSDKSVDLTNHVTGLHIAKEDFEEGPFGGDEFFSFAWKVISSVYYIFKAVVIIGLKAISTIFELIGITWTGIHHIY